jgi:cell division septal protein FtsQ
MPNKRSERYRKTATHKVEKKVKQEKPKKKRRLKIKNILILFLVIGVAYLVSLGLNYIKITNIYISGNTLVSDEEILDQSGLINYPSIFTPDSNFKNKLLKNELISSVNIQRKGLSIYLTITENYPLYYYTTDSDTVLLNGKTTTNNYNAPTVINYIPDTIYPNFLKAMQKVNYPIIERISEIKYDPDNVDDSRFLLTMDDGNYVYLTITKWDNINEYINIIKKFTNKRGILYLNAGNSFEVKETY